MAEGEGIEPLSLRIARFSGPFDHLGRHPPKLAEGARIELARPLGRLRVSTALHYRSATLPILLLDDIAVIPKTQRPPDYKSYAIG